MLNEIPKTVVAAVIVIVGLTAILTPMVMEMTEDIHSVESNPSVSYNLKETTEDIHIRIIDGYGYINNEKINSSNYRYLMIMFTDSFVMKYTAGNDGSATGFTLNTNTGNQYSITEMEMTDGNWTATTSSTQVTGTYDFCMAWSKNGKYTMSIASETNPFYANADSEVYIVWSTTETNTGLVKGTAGTLLDGGFGSMTTVFNVAESLPSDVSIQITQYTDKPDVVKITGATSGYYVFLPIKYDVITSFDEMLTLLFNMSPILIGLMFLAAIGLTMTRSIKN